MRFLMHRKRLGLPPCRHVFVMHRLLLMIFRTKSRMTLIHFTQITWLYILSFFAIKSFAVILFMRRKRMVFANSLKPATQILT